MRRDFTNNLSNTTRRPTIGLALSGGGAKAAAHVGALRILECLRLKFDLVAGTSGGALAGLFHCDGHSPDAIFEILQSELMGGTWWPWVPGGRYWQLARLFRRGILRSVIDRHVRAREFSELATPFITTATDLVTGESVYQYEGEVASAVMASMSLPGIAPPVPIKDRLLIDGGVLNNVPTNVLKDRKVDIIIAVDLGECNAPRDEWSLWRPRRGSMGVLQRAWAIQNRELTRRQLAVADVVIRPDVAEFGIADLSKMDLLKKRGEEAAVRAIPLIQSILAHWEDPTRLRHRGPSQSRHGSGCLRSHLASITV